MSRCSRRSLRFLVSLLALVTWVTASSSPPPLQVSLASADLAPHTSATTLVDVLSADAEYSTLIHLLQRTKLIPTLNKLNGSTLFAPTNDAFSRSDAFLHLLDNDGQLLVPDNILHQFRQNLLYHLLNFTLRTSTPLFPDSQPRVLETLLFPANFSRHTTPDPSPAPPWLPLPQGSLAGQGQRLRGFRRPAPAVLDEDEDGQTTEDWIGVDWKGEGGARILQAGIAARNGVVFKIDRVLTMPPDVGQSLTLGCQMCLNWHSSDVSLQAPRSSTTRP